MSGRPGGGEGAEDGAGAHRNLAAVLLTPDHASWPHLLWYRWGRDVRRGNGLRHHPALRWGQREVQDPQPWSPGGCPTGQEAEESLRALTASPAAWVTAELLSCGDTAGHGHPTDRQMQPSLHLGDKATVEICLQAARLFPEAGEKQPCLSLSAQALAVSKALHMCLDHPFLKARSKVSV